MKRLLPILLIASGIAGRAAAAEPMTVDGYAAIVNDHVITAGEVLESIAGIDEQLRLTCSGRELAARRVEAFSNGVARLVEQQLIVEEFKKNGGSLPDRIVNDRINEFINDRFRGDRAEFINELTKQRITFDEWKEGMRDRIVSGMLRRQEVNDKIRITPGQLHDAYERQKARFSVTEQAKIRMIVLHQGTTDDEREQKRQQAILLRGKIIGGESFAEIARSKSEDNKAASGGDWGWINPADLRDELKNAIAKMKPGQISEVLAVGSDYYLIQLEERREAGVKSFDSVRSKLEDEIRQTEGERLYNAWINRLKQKHNIKIFEASST